MTKNNKIKTIISSIIILLPIIYGLINKDKLPQFMPTHWSISGVPDQFSSRNFAIFVPTLIILLVHWVCIIVTTIDNRNKKQNKKVLGILYWIMPYGSIFINLLIYTSTLNMGLTFYKLISILMGSMFIFIGNYLPKTKQNRTIGIKFSWTLKNEENWNKTHRFAGKVWFYSGFLLMLSSLLPENFMYISITILLLLNIVAPIIYSYRIYINHKNEGVIFEYTENTKISRKNKIFLTIALIILFIILFTVMFTGDINTDFTENSFIISSTFWQKIEVDFDTIDNIEYSKISDFGKKIMGFNSGKLLLGTFKNSEFGNYTLYSYVKTTNVSS